MDRRQEAERKGGVEGRVKKGKWTDGEERTVRRDVICTSGWLHTHVHMGRTNWTLGYKIMEGGSK